MNNYGQLNGSYSESVTKCNLCILGGEQIIGNNLIVFVFKKCWINSQAVTGLDRAMICT